MNISSQFCEPGYYKSSRDVGNVKWSIKTTPFILSFCIQVQTEFERVSETQFVFNIIDAEQINHFVAFMTGAVPFPDGLGGAGEFWA